jgi:hypothetical protein
MIKRNLLARRRSDRTPAPASQLTFAF